MKENVEQILDLAKVRARHMSAQQQPAESAMTREAILKALGSLSEELGRQGVTGELCLFGGTVMVLFQGLFEEGQV